MSKLSKKLFWKFYFKPKNRFLTIWTCICSPDNKEKKWALLVKDFKCLVACQPGPKHQDHILGLVRGLSDQPASATPLKSWRPVRWWQHRRGCSCSAATCRPPGQLPARLPNCQRTCWRWTRTCRRCAGSTWTRTSTRSTQGNLKPTELDSYVMLESDLKISRLRKEEVISIRMLS